MLDKKVTTSGKIYTAITNLKGWDKNPRVLKDPQDLERLKKQLAFLGQYKPVLVTQDGIIVGGNRRLEGMQALNERDYIYIDEKNNTIVIPTKGKFDDVWVTELSFGEVEKKPGEENSPTIYRALIDGKVQDKQYNSVEQIMIEYALSDNDAVGVYDKQKLTALVTPYAELIPQENYKLEVSPSVSLKTFLAPDPEQSKADEEPIQPISKEGETYQLGTHRLSCGGDAKSCDMLRKAYASSIGRRDKWEESTPALTPTQIQAEGGTQDATTV